MPDGASEAVLSETRTAIPKSGNAELLKNAEVFSVHFVVNSTKPTISIPATHTYPIKLFRKVRIKTKIYFSNLIPLPINSFSISCPSPAGFLPLHLELHPALAEMMMIFTTKLSSLRGIESNSFKMSVFIFKRRPSQNGAILFSVG